MSPVRRRAAAPAAPTGAAVAARPLRRRAARGGLAAAGAAALAVGAAAPAFALGFPPPNPASPGITPVASPTPAQVSLPLSPGQTYSLGGSAPALAPGTILIKGRGDGHGVGLPQDGALALGRAGDSAAKILATFYPGTTLSHWSGADVHVAVWQQGSGKAGSTATVTLPSGGTVAGPSRTLTVPAGGTVTLIESGSTWTATVSGHHAATTSSKSGSSSARTATKTAAKSSSPALVGASHPHSASPHALTAHAVTTDAGHPAAQSHLTGGTPGDAPSTGATAHAAADDPTSPPASDTASPADTPSDTPSAPATDATTPPATDAPTTSAPATTAASDTATPGRTSSPTHSATASPTADSANSVSGGELTVVPSSVAAIASTGREYRGELVTAPGQLVNDISVEDYLLGLGEVRDPSWPQGGLQALVIAARTYALRDAQGAGDASDAQHVNICATDACQVYLGAGIEYAALTQAVHATDHEVLTYRGALAATYYSASAGGETATPAEGFGGDSVNLPYLKPVAYTGAGDDSWQKVVHLTAVSQALHYGGLLAGVAVTKRGPSGRVLEATLTGGAGDKTVTGLALASALGLPSTLFETGSGPSQPQIDYVADEAVTLPAFSAPQAAGSAAVPAPVLADNAELAQNAAAPDALAAAGLTDTSSTAATATADDPAGKTLAALATGPAPAQAATQALGTDAGLALIGGLLAGSLLCAAYSLREFRTARSVPS